MCLTFFLHCCCCWAVELLKSSFLFFIGILYVYLYGLGSRHRHIYWNHYNRFVNKNGIVFLSVFLLLLRWIKLRAQYFCPSHPSSSCHHSVFLLFAQHYFSKLRPSFWDYCLKIGFIDNFFRLCKCVCVCTWHPQRI